MQYGINEVFWFWSIGVPTVDLSCDWE